MAVLQHYGHRSWFIDVSMSPDVGLWFARHRFVAKKAVIQPRQTTHKTDRPLDHAFANVTLASYAPHNGDGFVFVFTVPGDDPALLLNLHRLLPASFLRVHAQR